MVSPWLTATAGLTCLIWLYLLAFHHGFWRCRERLGQSAGGSAPYPAVVALVPARDEAEVIEESLGSLLDQDYPGPFHIVVIDDQSSDRTRAAASGTIAARDAQARATVITGGPRPQGWSGKLWALQQGLDQVESARLDGRFFWLSDADIAHAPTTLKRLVEKAEQERRDLVSLMARLSCQGFWERLLIPPFVYFFQKLYPFAALNDPARPTAGAAGGCLLVRRSALARSGGLDAMRGALIDDCSLGRAIKRIRQGDSQGIWVGLADGESRSLRGYRTLAPIWDMVARSAYSQLRRSPALLLGAVLGMALTYLAAPVIVLSAPWHRDLAAAALALAAWAVMSVTTLPILRHFGLAAWRAPLLPLAALLYTLMTLDSARRHWLGRGGAWKGRLHADLDQRSPSG